MEGKGVPEKPIAIACRSWGLECRKKIHSPEFTLQDPPEIETKVCRTRRLLRRG